MLSGNLILGLFLILFGLSIFLKELFGISLPLVRLALAVFFIYLGITIISNMRIKEQQTVIFSHQTAKPASGSTHAYQTIFGDSTVDLTRLAYEKKPVTVTISTIFGNSTVFIDPYIPTKIIANSSFGEIRLPDNSTGAFGTTTYTSHPAEPELIVTVNTTFGKTAIREK